MCGVKKISEVWKKVWNQNFTISRGLLPRVALIFSLYEGNSRDFEGKWVAAAKFLTATNFCSYFLKVLTEMLLWCKFQVFWTIFGWFRAHFRSKSGIFPSNFIKGKSRFCAYLSARELPQNRETRLFLHSVKSFGLLNKFSII